MQDSENTRIACVVTRVDQGDRVSREVFELDGYIVFRIGPQDGKALLIRCDDPQWCYDAARVFELGGDRLKHAQMMNERDRRL